MPPEEEWGMAKYNVQKKLVKIEYTVVEICLRTDTQKHRHAHHNTLPSSVTIRTLLHPFNSLFSKTTCMHKLVPDGKTSLDLNDMRDDGGFGMQLDHMQSISTSLQTDNHTNTSSLNFYRLDALSDARPTVSKHWRQLSQSEYVLPNQTMHWYCHFHLGTDTVNCTMKRVVGLYRTAPWVFNPHKQDNGH